ncbi:type I restriction-modification system subunit M [Deinococcus wulumuqiensis]|uniref:site-specific DNA-methyltransferase (adenine-specific) n=1 Tax=Deinococcus wulumuqiensis TaxID=980427 RepID=A0AAV4K6C3_9DEIO|nr:class I SAM-dependent DNA methyltransferase [Deinococcus wulumuqiensis]QII22491.1 SAM-dependent DNA methyltransferase [Deinococcus wulumuqiensis R12]GGI88115.1 restriction endonuclease EcoEI subunit M [Deinococcus wulumuqiensis]GGP30320.1 restriction endonuclease EcoEI subunit M [Deinococcus wulumuqiensis]
MSIVSLVKSIQDIMRKDVGVDGDAQRISQLAWLLFLKILDDKEQEWELGSDYQSPIPDKYRWSNWAKDAEGITGDTLMTFVNGELFPTLKNLRQIPTPQAQVVASVFGDAYNYMKSGTLLRQVINTIEADLDLNRSEDRHLFGDIYEKILGDLQSAGNAGEYYTPRALTQFVVDMLAPQLGESVLDPACGTGGFLTSVIDALNAQAKTTEDFKTIEKSIHGVEKKPLPHMLAVTNMMLHGIETPSEIRRDNTLAKPLRDYEARDELDIIVANPPFGGIEENGIEQNFPAKYRTRETADLFMALIMLRLKPHGRAGVVLPDGFLFGEGVKTTIKEELLQNFNLHTIVRLPKGVFAPYTSINTNVLFFEKGGPTRDIWFFEHPYPAGYKSYSKSKPLTIGEFDLEKEWWGSLKGRENRQETRHAWKVSAEDVKARNYNLDFKNPHQDEVIHADPMELLAEYRDLTAQVREAQDALKAELLAALERRA